LENERLDVDPIKSRLINSGYPHPGRGQTSTNIREVSQEAQKARAELRDHIIDDIWALLDEVESLRGGTKR
jgi:hypothetical protein